MIYQTRQFFSKILIIMNNINFGASFISILIGSFVVSDKLFYLLNFQARLGLTEYQAVKQMYDGVKELIRLEQEQK